MRLIIGGSHQGKTLYTLKKHGISSENTADSFHSAENKAVFCDFQQAVQIALSSGEDPEQLTEALLRVNPEVIIICDEVGCGVVPVDKKERIWRETGGRLCCRLAERAESVERIFCGIPMKLK